VLTCVPLFASWRSPVKTAGSRPDAVKGRAAQNMGQASPGSREWSHVNMPSRPTIWGKAQLLSAVVSRQAFTCLEAAARFPKGLKTLIDPLAQLSINTARPVSFRTPATHHRHPRPPHPPEFQPSQWRLRYVPLCLPSSPPLRPADAPRLRCDRRANRTTAREVRPPTGTHGRTQHIDTSIARLSSPGFASRLSATMVSPHTPPALAAQANSPRRDGYVYEGLSLPLQLHTVLTC
jgi:hypothetical protein